MQNELTPEQLIIEYRQRIKYLKKVLNKSLLFSIKALNVKGRKMYTVTQQHIPFSMQMEAKLLISDSIEYYQRQIESLSTLKD